MPQCKVCGKKGIFLRLDASGRCPDCQRAYQEEQAEKARKAEKEAKAQAQAYADAEYISAKEYYSKIIGLSKSVLEDIDVADGDEANYTLIIPQINNKINLCNSLIELLGQYSKYNKIENVIREDITFKNDSLKRDGIGTITPFKKSVLLQIQTRAIDLEKVFTDLKNHTEKCLKEWERILRKYQSFSRFGDRLNLIEDHPVKISQAPVVLCDEEMPDLKTTGISSRSGYARLGTFVALDVETTGLNSDTCKIIEFASIRFEEWEPVEKMQTLINPQEDIPSRITSLTGITNEMVADCPTFEQIIPSVLDFIGKYNIVGHNLEFDIKFLYKSGLNTFSKSRKYYDTLDLARRCSAYKDMASYKLDYLCDSLGIRNQAESHRALSDCLATGELFRNIAIYYSY